jgi:hypothetical protein
MFCDVNEVLGQWRSFIPCVRVGAGREWSVRVCCSQPVGVRVHWFRRRTVPCVAAACACPACAVVSRPLVYLGAVLTADTPQGPQTSPPRILELPVQAFSYVVDFAKVKSVPLSAVSFRVLRHGGKRGRVLVDRLVFGEAEEVLSEREIVQALCRLWAVPAPRVGEPDKDWLTRVGVALACDGHYSAAKGGA